ncbi:MAG: hypothetical protein HQK72_07405 [Desulfamplus sp.]|nr:hypothetical protein [Desulfamplus sp.]
MQQSNHYKYGWLSVVVGLLILISSPAISDEIVSKWEKAYNEVSSDGTMEAIYKKWNVAMPTYKIPPAP